MSRKCSLEIMNQIIVPEHLFTRLLQAWIDLSASNHQEIALLYISCIQALLGNSCLKTPIFLQEFNQHPHSYGALARQIEISKGDARSKLVDTILKLSTLGDNEMMENVMEMDRDSPFQLTTFIMPAVVHEEFLIRNKCILGFCKDVYSESEMSLSLDTRCLIMEQLLQLIQLNPINYFIITSNSQLISFLIEKIDEVDLRLGQHVLAILKHVVMVLGFVPFRELSLLFAHFHGFSKVETTCIVTKTVTMFLESGLEWRRILRDLGLINTLSNLVSFIQKACEAASDGSILDTKSELDKFTLSPSITANFFFIMQLLGELLKDDDNLKEFRHQTQNGLFNLLRFESFAKGVSIIIRVLFTM
jgi:hypothetical protein